MDDSKNAHLAMMRIVQWLQRFSELSFSKPEYYFEGTSSFLGPNPKSQSSKSQSSKSQSSKPKCDDLAPDYFEDPKIMRSAPMLAL